MCEPSRNGYECPGAASRSITSDIHGDPRRLLYQEIILLALCSFARSAPSLHSAILCMEDFKMKLPIGIAAAALLATGFVTATPKPASAVIYCTYVGYPAGCVARPGVVLRPRPVARAAVRHNAGGNLNGGVNRVGPRR